MELKSSVGRNLRAICRANCFDPGRTWALLVEIKLGEVPDILDMDPTSPEWQSRTRTFKLKPQIPLDDLPQEITRQCGHEDQPFGCLLNCQPVLPTMVRYLGKSQRGPFP